MPRLFKLHQDNPDIKVSISASMLALHGDVIEVLDMVRRADIQKVGYQIRARTSAAGPPPPVRPDSASAAETQASKHALSAASDGLALDG